MGQPGPGTAMSRRVHDSWPPLIVAAETPTWIKWRDVGLTILMWVLFGIMLETEFELVIGRNLARLGFSEFYIDPNWSEFFARLRPYIRTTVVLIVVLIVAGLLTLRRRRISLLVPQPPALEISADAHRAGMDVSALAAARELPVVVVHIDADGRHRIEAGQSGHVERDTA